MAAIIFHEPVFATVVESGDKLFFYAVGTTTDYGVFTDFALTAAASQPVVADSNGRFVPLYIDGTGADFKVVLKDSTDVEKWTCERYPIDDITTTAANLVTAEADIVTLQGTTATHTSEISTLQTESADYESRITTLEGASTSGFTENTDFTGANQQLSSDGFQVWPGGLIDVWGSVSIGADTTATVTWAKAFPTAALQYGAIVSGATDSTGADILTMYSASTTGATIYNPVETTQTIRYWAKGY
jgi:hypothetical protein